MQRLLRHLNARRSLFSEMWKNTWGLGTVAPETSRGPNDIARKIPLVLRSKGLMLLQACTRRYGDFQAL